MDDLPPGFVRISGKQAPRNKEQEYEVMFRRNGREPYIDTKRTYRAGDLVWKDDGGSFCPIAVRAV